MVATQTLEQRACASLAWHLGLPASRILSRSNSEKYAAVTASPQETSRLREIFSLMKTLNEQAIGNPEIGSGPFGDRGLRDLVATAGLEIAHEVQGRPYHWVELGPEPSKTLHLFKVLKENAALPASYTAIDINPMSNASMARAVSEFLAPDDIHFMNIDYNTVAAADFDAGSDPLLITNLGFQEGNDTISNTRSRLLRLTRKGDFVLSEMQMIGRSWQQVSAFYDLPEMRRFSELTARAIVTAPVTEYHHFVVPVEIDDRPPLFAAVCAQRVDPSGLPAPGDVADAPDWIMTNVCLKLTPQQFRAIREDTGDFGVVWQDLTGDMSVAIQLARRL